MRSEAEGQLRKPEGKKVRFAAIQVKTVQLRFKLTNGSFYSYWFED